MSIPWFTVFITWFLFLPIPILNGYLRERWYASMTGTAAAHQIGVAILSMAFLIYAFFSLRSYSAVLSVGQLLVVGLVWLLSTVAFEFGIGLATGRSWNYMLADYKVWEGRVWPFFLLVMLLSPFIIRLIVA